MCNVQKQQISLKKEEEYKLPEVSVPFICTKETTRKNNSLKQNKNGLTLFFLKRNRPVPM